MKKLNQKDFIKQISNDTGYTLADIGKVFESIEKNIIEDMKNGNSVKLFSGIVFESHVVEEHMGFNPSSQEKVLVPERKQCKVKISSTFKNKINE